MNQYCRWPSLNLRFLFPIFMAILDPKIKSSEEKIKKKGLRTFLRKSARAWCQNDMLEVVISGVGVRPRALVMDIMDVWKAQAGHQPAHLWETPGQCSQGVQVARRHHPGTVESSLSQPAHYSITLYGPGTQRRTHGGVAAGVNLECVQCHDSEWSNYLAINPIPSFYPSPLASERPQAGFCLIS